MGLKDIIRRKFTQDDIKNRELVLKMLQDEDKYYLSDEGQELIRDSGRANVFSLNACKTIQRLILEKYEFEPDEESLSNYRTIFQQYYNSPTDYDKDILSSVYYMRENRLLYYTSKTLEIGDTIPNTELLEINGDQKTLFDVINEEPEKITVLAAFSLS